LVNNNYCCPGGGWYCGTISDWVDWRFWDQNTGSMMGSLGRFSSIFCENLAFFMATNFYNNVLLPTHVHTYPHASCHAVRIRVSISIQWWFASITTTSQ
jgi:hypothetical protein